MKKSTLALKNNLLIIVFLLANISLYAQDNMTIKPTILNSTKEVNLLEDSKSNNLVFLKDSENLIPENLTSNAQEDSSINITIESFKSELFVLKSRDEKATLTKKSVFFKFKVKYYWC